MLELQRLRDDKELAIELLQVRGEDARERIDQILEVDAKRRSTQHTHDEQQAEMNRLSKEIGVLFKSGKREEAEAMRAKTGELKDGSHELKTQLHDLGEELTQLLYHVPNIPNPLVPAGKSDADNQIIDEEGSIPQLPEGSVPHWDLTEKYNLIDFELGVKVTGAGFPIYRGKGAKLQRALINFFLDQATEAGYEEVIPPLLVNEASGYGTGQLPDKEGQMYQTAVDNLYLIPTGEVPITNIFRDVVLKEADLPQKCVGHTPCFRREAGSYGKDVRGLNRLHQFDKVEILQVVDPATSYDVLDTMVDHVKALLRKLELPFRVTRLCGGDLGYTAALTYDLEVYSAAQEKWLEVSSVSNFETYQSNRLKARIKGAEGKTHLAHTLNGSALALPRIVAALLENNQTAEGIRIPKALVPYTGFDVID
jgi:seryl-tRNA synthetase